MKKNNFQGELTDVSAKKEALATTPQKNMGSHQWFFFSRNIRKLTSKII